MSRLKLAGVYFELRCEWWPRDSGLDVSHRFTDLNEAIREFSRTLVEHGHRVHVLRLSLNAVYHGDSFDRAPLLSYVCTTQFSESEFARARRGDAFRRHAAWSVSKTSLFTAKMILARRPDLPAGLPALRAREVEVLDVRQAFKEAYETLDSATSQSQLVIDVLPANVFVNESAEQPDRIEIVEAFQNSTEVMSFV